MCKTMKYVFGVNNVYGNVIVCMHVWCNDGVYAVWGRERVTCTWYVCGGGCIRHVWYDEVFVCYE